eukprot:gene16836-8307_t
MVNEDNLAGTSSAQDEQHSEETTKEQQTEMHEEVFADASSEAEVVEDVSFESNEAEVTEDDQEQSEIVVEEEADASAGDPEPEEEEDSTEAANEEEGEEDEDDDDDEEDEDEEDPEDPADAIRESCSKAASCRPLMKSFETCEERVTSKSQTEETCLEEYLDFIKCRDKCKNPADNLLKLEDYYKWKCASGGESKAIVVLQLEKATQIHSIDIGNNGSAFVEVLVGRSSWDSGDEFKVLLVASSFMSPAESKSGAGTFRVRIFGNEKLNKAVASEKWDRVKLVCSQPYNKDDGYGLSFINLHSPPQEEKQATANENSNSLDFKAKIGRFALKEESDKDEIAVGSYFAKRLHSSSTVSSPTMAAAARDASSSIRSNYVTSSPSVKSAVLVKKKEHSSENERASVEKSKMPSSASYKQSTPVSSGQTQMKRPEHRTKVSSAHTVGQKQEATKRKYDEIKKTDLKIEPLPPKRESEVKDPPPKRSKKRVKYKGLAFHKLMENVVFVLSGYKNPERSDLRDKAISMGAKYRPDWAPGCTHLICAFKNTPKFNQVLGKGKIVGHKWIKDCAKRKERISVKEYRIDGSGSSSESEQDDNEPQHDSPGKSPTRRKSLDQALSHYCPARELLPAVLPPWAYTFLII